MQGVSEEMRRRNSAWSAKYRLLAMLLEYLVFISSPFLSSGFRYYLASLNDSACREKRLIYSTPARARALPDHVLRPFWWGKSLQNVGHGRDRPARPAVYRDGQKDGPKVA